MPKKYYDKKAALQAEMDESRGMKKYYKKEAKSKMDESRGMKKYYDKMKSAQEGGMIAGPVGMANLPQDVIMKYYPKGGYLPENINDGLSGVDKQMRDDIKETKSELSPTKY